MRIYGPVPSRRFGLSLGIDLVPHKTCPFDCIYCQLGETDDLRGVGTHFFEIEAIAKDIREALSDGPTPDVLTLAGSGEPTLYRPFDELMAQLKSQFEIPILLITNGALLWRDDVVRGLEYIDILAPSLDAGDEATYRRINQPLADIGFDQLVQGLKTATHTTPAEVRLEVMLIRDINDDEASLRAIARIIDTLRVDQIDINTPVRPPVPERGAVPCDTRVLNLALEIFGPKARAIGTFRSPQSTARHRRREFSDMDKDIREMLLRRPCTAADIVAALNLDPDDVGQSLERLLDAGTIAARSNRKDTYYLCPQANPTLLK